MKKEVSDDKLQKQIEVNLKHSINRIPSIRYTIMAIQTTMAE